MSKLIILCVEDERDVLDALVRDLRPFEGPFSIEATESVDEARRVVAAAQSRHDHVALVLADHILPGITGVQFLIELQRQPHYAATRKVLVTAQAGHMETIRAINEASLNHYIAKPWQVEELQTIVRRQLEGYVVETQKNLLPFMQVLDSQTLLEAMRTRPSPAD
ncbi:MAG TPA: response regulator [Tepidisphaeraceae bacterium]|nr:response regulator [Tepidisphaeraceae bacterium]